MTAQPAAAEAGAPLRLPPDRLVTWNADPGTAATSTSVAGYSEQVLANGGGSVLASDDSPSGPATTTEVGGLLAVLASVTAVALPLVTPVPGSSPAFIAQADSLNRVTTSPEFRATQAELAMLIHGPVARPFLQASLDSLLARGAISHADLQFGTAGDPFRFKLLGVNVPDPWGAGLTVAGGLLGLAGVAVCAATAPACGTLVLALTFATLAVSEATAVYYVVQQNSTVRQAKGESCAISASITIDSGAATSLGSGSIACSGTYNIDQEVHIMYGGTFDAYTSNSCSSSSSCYDSITLYSQPHGRCYAVKNLYTIGTTEYGERWAAPQCMP